MNTNNTKTVVITGATGFVGKELTLELLKRGYEIRVLTRNKLKAKKSLPLPVEFHEALSPDLFENAHALIHLAGEPIAQRRWSEKVKAELLKSRTTYTQEIISSLSKAKYPPQILIGTSAIGFYGDRANDLLIEESNPGDNFLSEICQKWENSYSEFKGRKAILRVGVVLGFGGALEKMLPAFRFGVAGKLSNGKQWMSWIHIRDLVNMYVHALEKDISGTFNAVSPEPTTNAAFTRELASTLSRPAIFPIPAPALKILFGEMSSVLLASQNVSAKKILGTGFHFDFPKLSKALRNLLSPLGLTGAYVFQDVQWLKNPPAEIFPFFSEATNLEKITPPWLNFHIVKSSTPEISEGTLIDYKLKIKGLPARWKTLISNWEPGVRFVDEQLKGPYQTWHHTHDFVPMKGGTLMHDRVVYRMPFGILGDVVKMLVVENDIRTIFRYRSEIIDRTFPT